MTNAFATLKGFQGEEGEKELAKKLKSLGPDLLNDKDFNKAEFVKIFKNLNMLIKSLLEH